MQEGKEMPKCIKCGYQWEVKGRSNNQNRYFRGVVVPMFADAMGESNHDYVADELKKLAEVAGIMRDYCSDKDPEAYRIKSTTELSTVQWEELMRILRMFGSSFYQIYIPEPNEPQMEGL